MLILAIIHNLAVQYSLPLLYLVVSLFWGQDLIKTYCWVNPYQNFHQDIMINATSTKLKNKVQDCVYQDGITELCVAINRSLALEIVQGV